MKNADPLLKICLTGDAVGSGRISLAHLSRLSQNLRDVLNRTGLALNDGEGVRRGKPPKNISESTALDLVLLTHGSPAAVLGFERGQLNSIIPEVDLGLEILKTVVKGLSVIQKPDESIPKGCDAGVLEGWLEMGKLFDQGVENIDFVLNDIQKRYKATFTKKGLECIQERIKEPQVSTLTIEGRLLMADFKEHGARCRVHPSVGEPVPCLFSAEQKNKVLENILHFVRVVGKATENPISKKITSLEIHDIERLDGDVRPSVRTEDFWSSPSLEELARMQQVKPMADVRQLFNTWPGEKDDGFDEAIDQLRHPDKAR